MPFKDQLILQGTDRLEVLRVEIEDEKLELTYRKLEKFSGLRNLEVLGGGLIGDFMGVFPSIRWLRLNKRRAIPIGLDMKKLVNFNVIGCPIRDDWRGWQTMKLTEIEGLEGLATLQSLDISRCENLTQVFGLEKLESLRSLKMTECVDQEIA
ncbi:unnamed protein product [Linum tenue]|uniref:Uncharacterized protein n=1 Tax=Linum tenue TaxID=586396 RepID=A0AAV0IAF4_9ROSI|nr:unnamed protein product [Linum tenue]